MARADLILNLVRASRSVTKRRFGRPLRHFVADQLDQRAVSDLETPVPSGFAPVTDTEHHQ